MASDLHPGPDSPPTDELRAAESALSVLMHIVHPISRDDLSRPTGSDGFDVAQLTDHLVDTISSIGEALGADLPTRDHDDSVERQLVAAGRATLDAFHRRHGLDGTVSWRGADTPVRMLAGVLAFGMLVHGWDYAVAVGAPPNVPDSLADFVYGLAEKALTSERRANGEFAEPVDPPDDATGFERLVAFTGRDPVAGRS